MECDTDNNNWYIVVWVGSALLTWQVRRVLLTQVRRVLPRYVIVASASSRDASANGRLADAYRYNESVTPNPRSPLDDYTLHMVSWYCILAKLG